MARCWPPNPCDEGSNPSQPANLTLIIGVIMDRKTYIRCMMCLDIIEEELNKIAKTVGHDDFDTWLKKQK